jgi:FhuF 2Fe-2S C-terminal domain
MSSTVSSPAETARALAAAATIGPFFVLAEHSRAEATGWRPLAGLVTDPAVLGERIGIARSVLAGHAGCPVAAIEPRVAASVSFLGLAARLVSPVFGAAVTTGIVPALTTGALWWQPSPAGQWPLAATAVPGHRAGAEAGLAAGLLARLLVTVAGPVLDAFGRHARLSPQVLWGNVASALGGAATVLAAARPQHAGAAISLAGELLARRPLLRTGELVQPDPADPHRFFVRRSCCLFYRVPDGGTCGDCVLVPGPVR